MERWKKRSVELLSSLAFGSEGSPSVVPYYPQKTEITGDEERLFVRNIPEKHGISSKRIYNLLCELEAESRANIHNLMILVDGEVIAECTAAMGDLQPNTKDEDRFYPNYIPEEYDHYEICEWAYVE